jgi:hypothetical protein
VRLLTAEETSEQGLLVGINRATERVARYCDVAQSSIKEIRKESRSGPNEELGAPWKERERDDTSEAIAGDFDRRVMRGTVQDLYVGQKTVPEMVGRNSNSKITACICACCG